MTGMTGYVSLKNILLLITTLHSLLLKVTEERNSFFILAHI
ncbi:rCG41882 [Rattus norvegicus]|uniref:RCG41882 n=1 Tax=Rattus norvegicus TaxID=10116 RepID=A6KKU3_RAT|nr:rCG41882 [Rattus norvegicus]